MVTDHEQHVAELADEVDGVRGEVGTVRSELRRMSDAVEALHKEMVDFKTQTQPIIDVYKGVITLRSVVVGAASIIIAFGVMGTAIIWLAKELQR